MNSYWVTLRGFAEQSVHVEATSKHEAQEKARRGEFDDCRDYPDFIQDENGYPQYWLAREPVEEE